MPRPAVKIVLVGVVVGRLRYSLCNRLSLLMKVLALLGAFLPTFHASDVIFGENGVVDISKTIDAALNGVNAVGRRLLVAHISSNYDSHSILSSVFTIRQQRRGQTNQKVNPLWPPGYTSSEPVEVESQLRLNKLVSFDEETTET